MNEDLIKRLKMRAAIRSQITTRKSVQEGKPDRIAELLIEAAQALTQANIEREMGFTRRCYNFIRGNPK